MHGHSDFRPTTGVLTRGLISEGRRTAAVADNRNPYRGCIRASDAGKGEGRRKRCAAVSCKMQIGIRAATVVVMEGAGYGPVRPGVPSRTYARLHTRPPRVIYSGWRGRAPVYVETMAVAVHRRRRRVSWPVTGDSCAVDITIMECVRLPLCLSP